MAPRLRIARSAMDHSGLFSDISAIRPLALFPSRPVPKRRSELDPQGFGGNTDPSPRPYGSEHLVSRVLKTAFRQSPGIDVGIWTRSPLLVSVLAEAAVANVGASWG